MTRKDLDRINSDRDIIDLRMQSEDLINGMESMSADEFREQAERIEALIDARISVLISQYKE